MNCTISVEVSGLDDAKQLLSHLQKVVPEIMATETNAAALDVRNKAIANLESNSNVNTGRLVSSIQIETLIDTPFHVGLAVGTPLFYGKYIEFGTPPHHIAPKYKKALAFPVGKRGYADISIAGRVKKINLYTPISEGAYGPGTEGKPYNKKGGVGTLKGNSGNNYTMDYYRAAYDVVVTGVSHPGTRANPFLVPAGEAAKEPFFNAVLNALIEEVK